MNKPPLLFRHPKLNDWLVYLVILTPAFIWFIHVAFTWPNFIIYVALVVVAWLISNMVLHRSQDALRKWRYAQIDDSLKGGPHWPVGPR